MVCLPGGVSSFPILPVLGTTLSNPSDGEVGLSLK